MPTMTQRDKEIALANAASADIEASIERRMGNEAWAQQSERNAAAWRAKAAGV